MLLHSAYIHNIKNEVVLKTYRLVLKLLRSFKQYLIFAVT